MLECEPFRQRPHGQGETVHDLVMAEIPECYGQSPRSGGRHEFRGIHGFSKDSVAVMVPQVAAAAGSEAFAGAERMAGQAKERSGGQVDDRGAVFTGQFGEYMSKNYINLQFKRLLKKHDFPTLYLIDISQHLLECQTVEVGATVIGANINLADK